MWKPRLKPREFRFRAGARTELDQSFLRIVSTLPKGTNISEFLKSAVVENELRKQELSTYDRLMKDGQELLETAQILNLKLQNAQDQNFEPEQRRKLQELTAATEQLITELTKIGASENGQ